MFQENHHSSRNRHVDIRLKFLRSKNNQLIKAKYKPTEEIAANLFTHSTSPVKFNRHMSKMRFIEHVLMHLMLLFHLITDRTPVSPLITVRPNRYNSEHEMYLIRAERRFQLEVYISHPCNLISYEYPWWEEAR